VSTVLTARCGLVSYEEARGAQKALEDARQRDEIADVLLLLEHPPVYTKGRRSEPGELPMGEDWYRMQGIEVCPTDRGGRVTYHGPGQLVGYPIVDLRAYGDDVHLYVRRLEEVMIAALGECGVEARCREGLTGVWVGERKIGSIGVHVNRGVTTHGFAVNVANDLQPFEWIVPCGIADCQVTSITRERGSEQSLGDFAAAVVERFGAVYDREPRSLAPEELAELVPGAAALATENAAALR
jgi:lipoyl(octanoyl) transferase